MHYGEEGILWILTARRAHQRSKRLLLLSSFLLLSILLLSQRLIKVRKRSQHR